MGTHDPMLLLFVLFLWLEMCFMLGLHRTASCFLLLYRQCLPAEVFSALELYPPSTSFRLGASWRHKGRREGYTRDEGSGRHFKRYD